MILVSFFSENNVLSDEYKNMLYIFEYQSNEIRAFRILGTPGIRVVAAGGVGGQGADIPYGVLS